MFKYVTEKASTFLGVREGFSEEVTFELRPERYKALIYVWTMCLNCDSFESLYWARF